MSQPTAGGDTPPVTMRAVVVTRPGGLDALEIQDVPVPVRNPGWVRIRVKAFGVNESEVTTRKGESDAVVTYPRVPGIEGVGVVDDVDENSSLRPGQQVATMMGGMGRSYDGAYAQYVTVPAAQVIPFETGLPWEVVGALPEMFQTAYGSLTTGLDLKAGQTLLIRGGTSAVGLSAATIAKEPPCCPPLAPRTGSKDCEPRASTIPSSTTARSPTKWAS
jgi:NADPH:quinone reductase